MEKIIFTEGVGEQVGRVCEVLFEFWEVWIVIISVLEVHALLWGFLSHWEHVPHVICCPACSRGSCPPVGVLFKFQEAQVIVTRECVCHVVHHPTCSIGFCHPVGVLFEFWEVWVIIVLLGTRLSHCSSSHSFHFVIWPCLSVSIA